MNFIHRYQPSVAWAQEINRLFDRDFRRFDTASANVETFHETDEAWILRADLPGFAKENVSLKLTDRTLELVAETPADRPFGGKYERQWKLGADVDAGGISARLENGVLELRFPKRTPDAVETKTIEVN